MAERRMRVISIAGSQAQLAPLAACNGCSQCDGGRCTGVLSGLGEAHPLLVERSMLPGNPGVGDEVLLRAELEALAVSARRVYGRVLLGLLGGAGAGGLLAALLEWPRDPTVAALALAGAAIALRRAALGSRTLPPSFRFANPPSPVES